MHNNKHKNNINEIDPTHFDKYNNVVPGWFDTVIIQFRDGNNDMDLNGMNSLSSLSSHFEPSYYSSVLGLYIGQI